MKQVNLKKIVGVVWIAAGALLLPSCSLPTGRVQFDPYGGASSIEVADGSGRSNGSGVAGAKASTGASASALRGGASPEFYEFRRRKLPPTSLLQPDNSAYLLGAGDKLQIEVVEAPETRAEAVVMPDGMLFYDVAEGVQASGRTLGDVETMLARQLEEEYGYPIVTASLMTPASSGYTILGQVRTPGSYSLTKPTTLLHAIAEAGGSGSVGGGGGSGALADLPRCVVVRSGRVLPVDFSQLIEKGDMRHNVYLQPGDYVFMPPEGKDRVYVLGAVKTPSAVPYSSRVSVVAALASAHGLAAEAYPQGALVVRGSFTDPKFAPVNLNKVMRGQQPNFTLLPGDIIWVPAKPWQKLSEYVKVGVASVASSYSLRESSKIFFGDVDNSTTAAAGVRTAASTSTSAITGTTGL